MGHSMMHGGEGGITNANFEYAAASSRDDVISHFDTRTKTLRVNVGDILSGAMEVGDAARL
jgi:hypothetical protein